MRTTELTLPTEPPLGATLTLPEAPRAAALIHQGAGVHDRDGNMHAVGFKSTLYRRVARELATRCGIATLRFDKRGHDRPAPSEQEYSIPQRLADAAAALSVLREQPEAAGLPVFLIGHSEGARVVAKIAETEPVAGVVSLAAPFGNIFELFRFRARRRLEGATGPARARAELAIEFGDQLEQMFREGAKLTPEQFLEFAHPYFGAGYDGWESYDWLAGHWADALQAAPACPMLLIQGGRDARLWPDNAARWRQWCEGRLNVSFRLIDHMGHDLNDARQKVFRVDDEVLEVVCRWIGTCSGA